MFVSRKGQGLSGWLAMPYSRGERGFHVARAVFDELSTF